VNGILERNNLMFAMIQSFYWASMCLVNAFLPMYLESHGYDKQQIGFVIAISSISLLVGQYVWGTYCYKYEWLNHKNMIIFCMLLGIGVNVLIPVATSYFVLVCVLYGVFTLTAYSMAPMIDAWIMFRKLDFPHINYGFTRGMGSASYAFVAVGFGLLFTYVDLAYMFVCSAIFSLLVVAIASRMKQSHTTDATMIMQTSGFGSSRSLLTNIRFVVFLFSVFLIFTAYMANSTFYGLFIVQLGGTSQDFGQGLFLLAFTEVPVLFMASWLLTKFRARSLLFVSFLFFTIKAVWLAQSTTLSGAILAQIAQSFSNGLFIPVCLVYLTEIVKKSEATVSYMIVASIGYGLGGIAGNALGGWISEQYGLTAMYEFTALLSGLGFLIFVGSLFMFKKDLAEQ
jgi:PPP family 3-phenylpropionic acid transporter